MITRMVIMLTLVGICIALVSGYLYLGNYFMHKAFKAMASPVQTVSTTTAGYQDWQDELHAIGSLRAVAGADLALETAGIVDGLHFASGDTVTKGEMLVHLRADDDVARRAALEAAAHLAEITLQRDRQQFAAQAISQAVLDTDTATLTQALAQLHEQQAIVAKKTLRAPFAGQIGLRAIDLGQYLPAGTTVATLQNLDTLYVDFTLPQQAYARIKVGQPLHIDVDAYPGQHFDGSISAIDPRVDATTRNLQVRADIANPGHRLLPGMFATATIAVGAPTRYLTLPQSAITYNAYGETLFLVDPQDAASASDVGGTGVGSSSAAGAPGASAAPAPAATSGPMATPAAGAPAAPMVVHQVFITTGPMRGDQVAVLTGLKEHQQVVTSGQIKLRNGTLVTINNQVQPSDDAHPLPVDE